MIENHRLNDRSREAAHPVFRGRDHVSAARQSTERRRHGFDRLVALHVAEKLDLDRAVRQAGLPHFLELRESQFLCVGRFGRRHALIPVAQQPADIAIERIAGRIWNGVIGHVERGDGARQRGGVPAWKGKLRRKETELVLIVLGAADRAHRERVVVNAELQRELTTIEQLIERVAVEIADTARHERRGNRPERRLLVRREALLTMTEPDTDADLAGFGLIGIEIERGAILEHDLLNAERAERLVERDLARRAKRRQRSHGHGLVAEPDILGGLDGCAESSTEPCQRRGLGALYREQGAHGCAGEHAPR